MKNSKSSLTSSGVANQNWFKGICMAFLIFFIIMFSIEITDRVLFRPKSIFERVVQDFEKQKGEIQILSLGQSDIQFGIVPDEFNDRTFNFAGAGESFIETYYKLKHYINDMPELKIVILSVTLPTFSSFRADEIQWEYFSYGYITYPEIMELYKIKGMMVFREKLLSYCPVIKRIQMINFFRNVKSLLMNQPIDKTEIHNGYVKETGSDIREENALRRVKRQFDGQNSFDDIFLLYFEKILKMCKDKNIKVITLSLPETDYYLKYSKKYVTKDQLYERVLENPRFKKHIDKHLDFLEDAYAADHTIFLNQDHLNYKGAVKFSKLISSELSAMTK